MVPPPALSSQRAVLKAFNLGPCHGDKVPLANETDIGSRHISDGAMTAAKTAVASIGMILVGMFPIQVFDEKTRSTAVQYDVKAIVPVEKGRGLCRNLFASAQQGHGT